MSQWFEVTVDEGYIREQRQKARDLKKTQWWLTKINRGLCEYCSQKFPREELTMDHVVPVARGGTSTKGNIVVSCKTCNTNKKLATPVDLLLGSGSQEI